MTEGTVGLVAIQKTMDARKDLLDDIFGITGIAKDSGRTSFDAACVSVHQRFETSIRVASAGLTDANEIGVGILEMVWIECSRHDSPNSLKNS